MIIPMKNNHKNKPFSYKYEKGFLFVYFQKPHFNNLEVNMKEEKFLLSYIKGVVSSFTISIILFYILGIILTSSKITEKIITPAILIITGLSILIATSVVMIKNNEKGLLKGGLIGLSYFSILYIVSSISMQNFEINVYSMIMLVITFICGSIGGIVGINIKSYKK